MKICFIADLRSPIATNWISHFVAGGHEVHLISTTACGAFPEAASTWLAGGVRGAPRRAPSHFQRSPRPASRWVGGRLWKCGLAAVQQFRPLQVLARSRAISELLATIRPELVHAMRIPFEGILAAMAAPTCPLIVSVWGNDFTLHAAREPITQVLTRRALGRASALHGDCARDLRLGREWGFHGRRPMLLAPGNGGVRRDLFFPSQERPGAQGDADAPVVINPRGFRSYIRNDTFFQSIPLVLERAPQTVFLCVAMKGTAAESWVKRMGVAASVRLLPPATAEQMASFFRSAQVSVSPATHDGTPNSLLEAMACGCLPVAGNIEPVREWIDDGANGILCDTGDPASMAAAILRGISDSGLRERARRRNGSIVAERADYTVTMDRAENFYVEVAAAARGAKR